MVWAWGRLLRQEYKQCAMESVMGKGDQWGCMRGCVMASICRIDAAYIKLRHGW